MRLLNSLIFCALLSMCPSISAHEIGSESRLFTYPDGEKSVYFINETDSRSTPDSIIFFYGGSGCISWKSYLPIFSAEIGIEARYIALNKRHVDEEGKSLAECGNRFHLDNNFRQWMSDYMEFISATLANMPARPRNVVLVGISEGGMVAARVARARSDVTHLIVIGDGGWSMRENLNLLSDPETVSEEWSKIASDPSSITKTWLGNPYRYWFDVMDYSPLEDYLALDIPVLIAVGERDRSVSSLSALDVKRAATTSGKKNIGVVVYPGADHFLKADGFSYRADFLHQAGQGIKLGVSP